MKKHISLIILIVLLCPIILLSGCNKEKRNISNFYTHYLSISESHKLLKKEVVPQRISSVQTINKVGFSYSDELQQLISNNSSVYNPLDSYYNTMLDDSLAPLYLYSQSVCANPKKISSQETTFLFKKLDQLKLAYIETANRLGDVEKTLNNTSTNRENLQKLYTSYENLIELGCELSIKISNIYFNKILTNSNPQHTKIDAKIADKIANDSLTRFVYYKTIYLDIYLNTQIIGNNVASKLALNSQLNVKYVPYSNLKDTIYTDKKTISSAEYEQLLSLSNTLYNIQLVLDDEYAKYKNSISEIIYPLINNSSNIEDKTHKNIVDKFISSNGIVFNSFYTISTLMDLCYNKI